MSIFINIFFILLGIALLAFDTSKPFDPSLRGCHESLLTTIQKSYNARQNQPKTQNTIQTNNETITAISITMSETNKRTAAQQLSYDKEEEQLRIFANYLVSLQRISDNKRIPINLLKPLINNNKQLILSNLQNKMIISLTNALNSYNNTKYSIIEEYSCFSGVFPVDAGVFYNKQLIALIEIDGPHHYRYDGRLRRNDQLKEMMYKRINYDVIMKRIRWDEINSLGIDNIAEELVSTIIRHSKNINQLSRTYKSIEREFASFFSWHLMS